MQRLACACDGWLVVHVDGQAEVSELQDALVIKQDILRLDVPGGVGCLMVSGWLLVGVSLVNVDQPCRLVQRA